MSIIFSDRVSAEARAEIVESVVDVHDPCSVLNGTRLNFVELGMIESIDVPTPHRVMVRMLLDDPVCLYVSPIAESVRDAVMKLSWVDEVDIQFSGDSVWTDERATEATRAKIRERRLQRTIAFRTRYGIDVPAEEGS